MFNQLIGQFLAAEQSSNADMDRVAMLESDLFPNAIRPATRPRSSESRQRYRRAFLKRLTANVVDKASLQLGRRVDETRVFLSGHRNVWLIIDAGEIPDLDKLWHALVASDSQPVAVDHAANLLRGAFSDNAVLSMRLTRSNGIIRLAAVSEPAAGQPSGMRWLRAGAIERARLVVIALAVFAKHYGKLALAACLREFRVDASFVPTQRRQFPGAEIRQFNEHWEIRLHRELAESLARFIGD
ncbi:hypothetical protein SAMN05216345_111134 [Cupriavidus sp. YR651]|uniref:hypothetical protein n=1 Tax=Cupriavidus sp. YR651 TaxID=1855315 RepID=UPI00088A5070|nr:hypothetical protein [Cupriavidus sp. YR651]SDD58223.1 hypothetical protein SAMN05216345_111134 [Cupriavidus sp. YR651]